MERGNFSDEREEEVEEQSKDLPPKRSLDESKQWSSHQYDKDVADVIEELRMSMAHIASQQHLLTFEEFWAELWAFGAQGFAARSRLAVTVRNLQRKGVPLRSQRYRRHPGDGERPDGQPHGWHAALTVGRFG